MAEYRAESRCAEAFDSACGSCATSSGRILSNKTTEVGVFSLVNDAHAAAKFFYDAVVPDRLADHGVAQW